MTPGEDEPVPPTPARGGWSRFLPLLALAAGLGLFLALRLDRYVSVAALGEHRDALLAFVDAKPVAAGAAFVAVYALAVACSIPGAVVLTLAGGFLFGTWLATLYVVTGATAGAVGVFLAARTALGDALRRRAGPRLARLETGFRENAFSYLLFLRLLPLAPFWLVNLVPAFLGVRLRVFALATVIGIVPASFIYASVGSGLGAVLAAGGTPDPAALLDARVLLPLLGLAALALAPVAYRKLKGGPADD